MGIIRSRDATRSGPVHGKADWATVRETVLIPSYHPGDAVPLVSEQSNLPIQASIGTGGRSSPQRPDPHRCHHAIAEGHSPILLTERKTTSRSYAERLRGFVKHLVVLQGGMSENRHGRAAQPLAAIPDGEERLVLATGRYIGEGFDDARLDTLFLALPFSWKGTTWCSTPAAASVPSFGSADDRISDAGDAGGRCTAPASFP